MISARALHTNIIALNTPTFETPRRVRVYFFRLNIITLPFATMSAHQRIQRRAHPSRYGASLTAGSTAPPLPTYTTYKAIGAADRRKKRIAKAAVHAVDKGKDRMENIVGAVDADEPQSADVVQDIITLVQDHAAAKGVNDVEDLVESIIQASVVARGKPAAVNEHGYDGEDPKKKWDIACQNASEHMSHSRGGYCNAVFGAAGICGIGYAQAYLYVKKLGLASQMRNFAGCSSGSIAASLLACGVTPERILEICLEKNFSDLINVGARSILRFGRKAGIDNGKNFSKWIRKLIKEATGDSEITLAGVHNKYGGRLIIVAVQMTENRAVYLDYTNEPDLPLWKAIRMSCSIPFLYTPVEHNGHYYTDGGLIDPLPMKAFHYENENVDMINPRTIAFLAINEGVSVFQRGGSSLVSHTASYIDCILSRSHNTMMDEQDWARTIVIDCGKMSSVDFSINKDQKKGLFEKSRLAVIDHFAKTKIPTQRDYYGACNNGFSPADEPEPKENQVIKTVRRHRRDDPPPPATGEQPLVNDAGEQPLIDDDNSDSFARD